MSARELALAVVRDVFPVAGNGVDRSAQEAFDYRARKTTLDLRDRAFATELAYGAIKMRRALDWYLQPFVGDRDKPLPPAIAEILRLAVYELVYTRPDVHATVFEWVNLAKKYGHPGVAGLVNAVLRSFLRDRPPAPSGDLFEGPDDYLATRWSLPTWLVRQWRAVFVEDELEAICAGVDAPARGAIVVDERRADPAALPRGAPSPFVPECLLIDDPSAWRSVQSANHDEAWWLQSESSAMPVAILNPMPGEAVLDVCSGRGNKALQIWARLGGEGTLTCIERDTRKAQVLERRLAAAQLPASIVVGDATQALLPLERRFDRVLLDAPCSGVGVVGRHPEARWRKHPDDGARLATNQSALLERAAAQVAPGGVLVYAVCSTDPRETTDVVETFLQRQPFERGLIPATFEALTGSRGDVLVAPGIEGRDGFYIARLERRS
ncbi:MAG: transcription antitermination factor NusB [Vulcanimicrobiaceae bacterium]